MESLALWAEKETGRGFDALATVLDTQDYLIPSGFSAADISVGYMLLLAKFAKVFDQAPACVKAYWDRLSAREAWKKASNQ